MRSVVKPLPGCNSQSADKLQYIIRSFAGPCHSTWPAPTGARPMATISVSPAAAAQPRALSNLLFLVAGLVFAMVVVGGITRLTESGLSITEWKPISGVIPPLTAADWNRAFDL